MLGQSSQINPSPYFGEHADAGIRFSSMNKPRKEEPDDAHKEKQTMDGPQEEFIQDQCVPSKPLRKEKGHGEFRPLPSDAD